MKKIKCKCPSFLFIVSGVLLLLCTFFPLNGFASSETDEIREQLRIMNENMKALQDKLEKLEQANAEKKSEIEEMDERLNKAELHTATDKISFGIELRSRAESLHYKDMRFAPTQFVAQLFQPYNPGMPLMGGINGATLAEAQSLMGQISTFGIPANKVDADNDIIYTNKFRLNMKAKINNNLSFAGRLAAYKVWGDSTGVKYNTGSLGDVTLDGNTSSLPHGDTIHLERAYFNYKNRIGEVPINFSVGRRPSTEGPPLEYGNYSLEGGSPLAPLINWQYDGISLSFGLEEVTGIPGADFKFCYGIGFEGEWGNSTSLNESKPDVDDVTMLGFISTLFDDDNTSLILNYAHASDVTDGFTGLTVMPFIVSKQDSNGDGTPEYYLAPNTGAYISRMEPYTNIGDWDGASLLLRTNLSESLADIDFFLAGSWSHTDPSKVSENPFFELMGQGLLSSNGDLESQDGYSVYTGAIFPMPLDARFGLEFNWGSKYWFNFTGAEDSLVASKLAARGKVYEAYYIQPIFRDNFFLKLGGQYYDYDYTGSGNPMGAPVKIDGIGAVDTLNTVIDKVWLAYLSANLRW